MKITQTEIISKMYRDILLMTLLASCFAVNAQNRLKPYAAAEYNKLHKDTIETAYGKQAYNAISSSINTINSNIITQRATPSVGQSLSGRLPGLYIRNTSGIPGSGVQMFVRGQGTYNSTEPLVIVDGFRTSYDQLSIYEIESVSVLKDAGATALYGMEAANGVLLITTKRGKAGKMQAQASFTYGVQQPTQLPQLLNATEYATYYNQARVNDKLSPKYDAVNDIPFYGQSGDYQYTHPSNNFIQDFLLKSAPILHGGLNLRGGTKNARYSVSLGYLGDQGILNHTNLNDYSTQIKTQKINLRSNLDVEIVKGLTTSVDVAFSFDRRNSPGVDINSFMNTLMQTPPLEYPIKNPNGTLGGTAAFGDNPLGMVSRTGYNSSLKRNLDVNIRLDYAFENALKGLSAGLASSTSTAMTIWDNKVRNYATYSIDDKSNLLSSTYTKHGDSTDLNWQTDVRTIRRISFESNIKYNRTFGKHALNGLAMLHFDRYTPFTTGVTPYDFDNGGLSFRLNYGYANKYFAELSGSYYGQEQYKKENRFKFFPSVSGAWIASNEDFLKDNKAINYLKLKGSYGVVGGGSGLLFPGSSAKSRIFHTQYYDRMTGIWLGETGSYAPAGSSFQLGTLANPYITCDFSHKTNIALEATLLNHVNLTVEFFNDKRTDILTYNNDLPATLGFSGRNGYVNGGEVLNRGYEVTLGYFGKTGDFSYSVNGMLSFTKSKVIKRPDVVPLPGIDNRSGIGMPVGQLFGYEALGFYASDDEAQHATVIQTFGYTQAGDVMYKDNTGDNKIDISDMVPLGYSFMPQYNYSLNVELNYKGFSLSVFGEGIQNSSVMMGGFVIPFSTQGNAYKWFTENSWSPDNAATAKYPRLSTVANANNSQSSSIWLASRDYIKLRNVEFAYHLPEKWIQKVNLSQLKVYVSGNDLFTYAKDLKHIDPETLSYYPAMKSVNFGLSFSF
jgi:TonB-linked SusC/RagA family outer membrane protein